MKDIKEIATHIATLDRAVVDMALVAVCDVLLKSGGDGDSEYDWSDALEAIHFSVKKAVPL